jgi:hypothetical protein
MINNRPRYENYPWFKIIPRWLLGGVEIGLSIWAVVNFNLNAGLFLAAWWAISLFVFLPLIRCTKCYYYGRRCNTAWGLIAKFAFSKSESRYFESGYAFTVLLWPLRVLPFALGLLNLLDGFSFNPDGLFGIYVLAILLHRLFYRKANCPGCHQREICPVFNPQLMRNGHLPDYPEN